jgi:hypothetical protein
LAHRGVESIEPLSVVCAEDGDRLGNEIDRETVIMGAEAASGRLGDIEGLGQTPS